MHRPKVLILYCSYGDGHYQVSRALAESFAKQGIRVDMVDLYKEAHPVVDAVMKYIYLKSYKILPLVYGWVYYSTKKMNHDSPFSRILHSFGMAKLKQILKREKPDVIINTFPLLLMPAWRKKTGVSIPTYMVVTDFDLHQRWVHPHIDKFYVATEDLKQQVQQAGISPERIYVSGIPAKQAFHEQTDNRQALHKYGADPAKKSVLIVAGSYGVMQGLKSLCAKLAAVNDLQIFLVCGKNKFLKTEMDTAFAEQPNVHILGFVDKIDELMRISTCIITKPGGITLTESIITGLPIVVYRPVPGQERDNALYLAEKGAAFITYKVDELIAYINELLHNTNKLEQMRQAVASLRKPNSADAVVNDILNEYMSGQINYKVGTAREYH